MRRLIWGFAGPTDHIVGNLMWRLIYQINGQSIFKWSIWWFFQFPLVLNLLPHNSHWYGFSPVCILSWIIKFPFLVAINTKWLRNEGQKYCRMLQREHSAIFWPALSDSWSWKPILVVSRVAILHMFDINLKNWKFMVNGLKFRTQLPVKKAKHFYLSEQWPFNIKMKFLMFFPISLGVETLSAMLTLKRFLSSMYSLMDYQVSLSAEDFTTKPAF